MKKLFLVLAAAFAMVACQTDINEVGVVADGVATVEFEVGTPQMRAYSDGLTVDDLQYAVYEVKGEGENKTLTHLSSLNGAKKLDGLSTNVQIELANNKKYAVIFWADDENAPYKFEPAANTVTVTVDYDADKTFCNDENRDAFYAYKEFEVKGAATIDVVLRRPFAQVNVGTSDIEAAKKSGFNPLTSALVVKNVCNVLNLATGEATGGVDVTFKANAIPTGEDFPYNKAEYKYLAMSYVLVGKDQASYDVTYTITDGTTSIENTIGAVPMRANYRTNIYGKLLTSTTDIDVEIKPGYNEPSNDVEAPLVVAVATAQEFNEAIANAKVGEIVLSEDLTLDGSLVFGAPTRASNNLPGRAIVIDGNGKTIKMTKYGTGRVIDVTSAAEGANLTLKNLTIENNVSWIERIVNYNTNGTLTLEGVKIVNAEGCSCNYAVNLPGSSDNAVVTIKDSEIWAGAQALNLWGEKTVVNVTNSELYVVDDSAAEGRSVVAINNDGETIADYSVLNFIGGSIKVVYVGEGETMPSYAIRNNTAHSTINISDDTVVVGDISNPVAIIYWEGLNQYYSSADLNAALDAAVPKYKATGVRMVNDLTLPLAKKAIYGTPVAVQMKNGGVFDGCNNTLSVENPVYNAYVVETYGGTIKNLNITTPAGRGIIISSPKEDIYLDNVVVNGPGYALNTTEHNGKKLVVTNSTFKGWTSLAGLESVSFTSCTFGENTYAYWQKNGYDQDYDRLLRPYVSTVFEECVFEKGFYVDLSALAANASVTLKYCTCEGVDITAENYSQYITFELPEGRSFNDCVSF